MQSYIFSDHDIQHVLFGLIKNVVVILDFIVVLTLQEF